MTVDVRAKLAEKGLTLPVAAKPVAAYVPAVRTGKIVFTAGQLPLVNGAMADTGKVGDEITQERAKELAEICALNCLAAVELVAPVDSIVKIIRVVCYVNGASGANGFAGVYAVQTTGDGTTAATLTAVSSVSRGTNPVSSVQIANDGSSGAIKLTITYINNSGVVTGGGSTVTFFGQIA
jgi:enamine deaminase RidA (YjgF/YER057c/UK114 family)